MKIEEKLRAAMREYTDSVRPEPSAWDRIQEGMSAAPPLRRRAVVVGFLAAAAVGALIVVRIVADNTTEGLRFVTPPSGQPTQAVTTPTPSVSPSPNAELATITEQGSKKTLTTPAGDWRLTFPSSWNVNDEAAFGPPPGLGAWHLSTYDFTAGQGEITEDDILFSLSIEANQDSVSTADLVERYCNPDNVTLLVCKTIKVNGSTWGRVSFFSEADGDVRKILTFHATPERIYLSSAQLFVDDNVGPRTALVEEVVSTFEIQDPN